VRRLRRLLFWLHLLTGVAAGSVIAVMAATGAVLALKPQILAFVERNARTVPPDSLSQPRLGVRAILEAAREARPDAQPTAVTIDAAPASPAAVAIGRGTVYVDPHSGRVLGESSARAQAFFRATEDWHRWLGMSGAGRSTARAVTGACNAAFLALAISGLYLWWPHKWTPQHSKAVLLFRRTSTGRARDFNWHNVIGFWCAPVLIVLTTTGVVMSYPWVNALLYRLAGSAVPQAARSGPGPSGGADIRPGDPPAVPDTIDRVWANAERQRPEWRTIGMRLPARPGAPVTFTISDSRSWNPFARSQLTLDARSGAVMRWDPYEASSAGQKARGWVRFGHTGELAGLPGQILAALACVGALFLVITGWSLACRRLARSRSGGAIPVARAVSRSV